LPFFIFIVPFQIIVNQQHGFTGFVIPDNYRVASLDLDRNFPDQHAVRALGIFGNAE
jgi:nitrogen fixation protein FixH